MPIVTEVSVEEIENFDPIVIPVEKKEFGFLRRDATFINCPACQGEGKSVIRYEEVTCLQKFLKFTNWCENWKNRYDVNHYCSRCGCYIGRYVPIRYTERWISKKARKKAARDVMILKEKPKDCAQHMQKARDRAKVAKES